MSNVFSAAGAFLSDYAASLGMDTFKDKFGEQLQTKKLKELIEKYLSFQQKENYSCTFREEIDFEGFCQYAKTEMLDDIRACVFSPGMKYDQALEQVKSKAQHYARSCTPLGQKRIVKMTTDIVDILSSFYRRFNSNGTLLLVNEIERQLDFMCTLLQKAIAEGNAQIIAQLQQLAYDQAQTKVLLDQLSSSIPDPTAELGQQLEAAIAARKSAALDYSLFPWFRESPRYRDVFPELFIDPVFREHKQPKQFSEIQLYCTQHVVILGEAGAGKSTLLRYLFAFSRFPEQKCVYLTATEARAENDFFTRLRRHAETSRTEYLVFIDGIDEEFANDYPGFVAFLMKLQSSLHMKFWLGCRSDFYERQYNEQLSFIRHSLSIAPWSPEQSHTFIERYSRITERPGLEEQVETLGSTPEMLAQFKSNPFQLSLLLFLAEHCDEHPISGPYDLYDRFLYRWIEREQKRGTSPDSLHAILMALTQAAVDIYNSRRYILSPCATRNSAVRNLLLVQTQESLHHSQHAAAFYHRSLAAFLLAHSLICSFLDNDVAQMQILFRSKLKDDVTNFVGNKFTTLSPDEKQTIKQNLWDLYLQTDDSEVSIKEQIVYYITRLEIDVSDFLIDLVKTPPEHPIMRLTIAYGCVLSDVPQIRDYALQYAKSIAADSQDAVTNRAWTVVYFGDVNDRDPYTYADDEKRPWQNARKARIKRFTKKTPRLKDYRFRLFDIPLFHSFLRDRGWDHLTREEYAILQNTDFPKDVFNKEERDFLLAEKALLLSAYQEHLSGKTPETPEDC